MSEEVPDEINLSGRHSKAIAEEQSEESSDCSSETSSEDEAETDDVSSDNPNPIEDQIPSDWLVDDENILVLPPEDYEEDISCKRDTLCSSVAELEGEAEYEDPDPVTVNITKESPLIEENPKSQKAEEKCDASKLTSKPEPKKKRKKKWMACLTNCKYESVHRVCRRFGFKEVNEDDEWHLFWTDWTVSMDRVNSIKQYQKINHFPGMSEICRKDCLARNMNRMLKLFPKEYNIFPKSWSLPADYGDLQNYAREKKRKTYILKPDTGCQGRGIRLTKSTKDISPNENVVCQVYITKPFLLDGYKFDLRIYAVITSCDPLRLYIYKDGLARLTTVRYTEPTNSNVHNTYMHLTNYAVQKHNNAFIRNNEEGGTKRRLTTLNRWFVDNGYNVDKIWADIDDIIIKTFISAHGILKHNYRTCFPSHIKTNACFEILGFDILLDRKLKPYVIEVNHSPSFSTDSKLDKEIKDSLIWDTLTLANFGAIDKKKIIEEERKKIRDRLFQKTVKRDSSNQKDDHKDGNSNNDNKWIQMREEMDRETAKYAEIQERYELAHLNNFRKIYPMENAEKYDKYFSHAVSLFSETASFKARSECARQQREMIRQKQESLERMKRPRDKRDMRPESPNSRRKKLRDVSVNRVTTTSRNKASIKSAPTIQNKNEWTETWRPQPINDDEELNRKTSLIQRENLIRGLGVIELLHRMFSQPNSNEEQTDNNTNLVIASSNGPSRKPIAYVGATLPHRAIQANAAMGDGYYEEPRVFNDTNQNSMRHAKSWSNVGRITQPLLEKTLSPVIQVVQRASSGTRYNNSKPVGQESNQYYLNNTGLIQENNRWDRQNRAQSQTKRAFGSQASIPNAGQSGIFSSVQQSILETFCNNNSRISSDSYKASSELSQSKSTSTSQSDGYSINNIHWFISSTKLLPLQRPKPKCRDDRRPHSGRYSSLPPGGKSRVFSAKTRFD